VHYVTSTIIVSSECTNVTTWSDQWPTY